MREAMDFDRNRELADEPPRPTLIARLLGERPADRIALALAGVVCLVVAVNALGRQTAPHPAPLFAAGQQGKPAAKPAAPNQAAANQAAATPTPAPRPADIQTTASIQPPAPLLPAPANAAAPAAARPRHAIAADVQRELKRLNLYAGEVDSRVGPQTQAAIRAFETRAGLKPTGEPTEALLARLRQPVTAARTSEPRRAEPTRPEPARAEIPRQAQRQEIAPRQELARSEPARPSASLSVEPLSITSLIRAEQNAPSQAPRQR